jgi:membrane protein implicated in regulation of membrane protease activity
MHKKWIVFLNRFLFGDEIESSTDFTSPNSYMDPEAVVVEMIVPGRRGQVSCGGSFWLARCTQPTTLMPDTLVRVKGRDNITLLVEPIYPLLPAASLEQQS